MKFFYMLISNQTESYQDKSNSLTQYLVVVVVAALFAAIVVVFTR
jgi:hypothetical protein